MSLLSRLFGGRGSGGGASGGGEPSIEEYLGFRIIADPIPESGQFRIAARIEVDRDGEIQSHRMIRADVIRDRDEAIAASLRKAKQMIDEQGARIFG